MPKRGENIYKRKDSRWEGRYIKGYDGAGKAKYGYVYAHSYHEVKEKLLAARTEPAAARAVSAHKNVATWCEEWLVLQRSRVKPSTYAKYYTILHNHVCAALGDFLPARLNTVVIEQFSNTMLREEGLSEKTVKDILIVLHAVLDYIRTQNGTLPPINIVYPKENHKEMRVLSRKEQQILVAYLQHGDETVHFGILLALYTGLRVGELCALRWGDISLEEGIMTVGRTMQRLQTPWEEDCRTRVVIGEPKSDTSRRRIPLTRQAWQLCREHTVENPEAYVCTGEAERYLEPRCVQYHLEKIARECGLEDLHFHVLRHTFATRCVEVGFEIKSLSEILGHAGTKVTLDRYVHASLELKRANMDKLAELGM